MAKFEKVKNWCKENKGKIAIGCLVGGTAVVSFILGEKYDNLCVARGLQQFIEKDRTMVLCKPHSKGDPIVELGADEWCKMFKDNMK